jgi:arylsulfatase
MATEFNGKIKLDIRDSEPEWGPYAAPTAPEDAPNVLYLVWDDTGIATWDCFGGLVEMPTMSRIAERGVRLSQFHTTALCSPTRASLLTGRNATTVGMATIEEFTDGFPGCNGRIPNETALLSEVLVENGYNTYCVGKWHLTPLEESNLAATKRHWPLSRGFERFYGFMGGETDQWYPELVYDNHPVAPPGLPENGYHLSKDIADKTIEFIRDAKVIAFPTSRGSYVCPGADTHRTTSSRSGSTSTRASSTWLRALPRNRAREPEEARHRPARYGARRSIRTRTSRDPTASRGLRRTRCVRGIRSAMTTSGCSAGWPRCSPAS